MIYSQVVRSSYCHIAISYTTTILNKRSTTLTCSYDHHEYTDELRSFTILMLPQNINLRRYPDPHFFFFHLPTTFSSLQFNSFSFFVIDLHYRSSCLNRVLDCSLKVTTSNFELKSPGSNTMSTAPTERRKH